MVYDIWYIIEWRHEANDEMMSEWFLLVLSSAEARWIHKYCTTTLLLTLQHYPNILVILRKFDKFGKVP